ncbi:MAG: dihydrodipicolinate reductase [Candidatus Hodarchaeota archaeon]
MNAKFNVIQVGLGPMGRIIAKLFLERKNINLKAAIDIDPKLKDINLSDLLNIEEGKDVIVESDLKAALSRGNVDVVFIATKSFLEKVAPLIKLAVELGSNVISICEELSYPFQYYPKLSEELDLLAKSKNVTIVGTGINPGYLMDLLPIVITAPCQKIESIKVTRMMNSAKRRESFQRKIGTGLNSEEFNKSISKKEITGHVGLTQSIHMIIAALGLEYDEINEFPPKAIIAENEFITTYGEKIPKGHVCGLESTAIAKQNDREIIVLNFIAYAGDHEEYDSIEIKGIPNINQKIIGGVHGDLGTAAIVVNSIPKVINAKSGLLTMKDLPVPCYTENIWKN